MHLNAPPFSALQNPTKRCDCIRPSFLYLLPPSLSPPPPFVISRIPCDADDCVAVRCDGGTHRALAELDEEETAEEDDAEDGAMQINYEEFADEFAQISLDIARAVAESGERRTLMLDMDGGEAEVDDDLDVDAVVGDVNLEDDEYMVSRAGTI